MKEGINYEKSKAYYLHNGINPIDIAVSYTSSICIRKETTKSYSSWLRSELPLYTREKWRILWVWSGVSE